MEKKVKLPRKRKKSLIKDLGRDSYNMSINLRNTVMSHIKDKYVFVKYHEDIEVNGLPLVIRIY